MQTAASRFKDYEGPTWQLPKGITEEEFQKKQEEMAKN